MNPVPESGAFEEYCAFTVTKEAVGNQDNSVWGPWPNELKAKADKSRHERKGRECTIVETRDRDELEDVFDD